MRDYIEIGPTPSNEDCQQIGTPSYDHDKARAECRRFIEVIRSTVGPEPEGARLSIKSNPHDAGTYLEVACYYEDDNEVAEAYAYKCESDAPTEWPEPLPTCYTHPDKPTPGQPTATCTACGQHVSKHSGEKPVCPPKFTPPPPLKFTLQRVHLNSGGYTTTGQYYGTGMPVYYAAASRDGEDVEFELRAYDRDDAKASILHKYPNATFNR
jgi:hypothetical protein